MHESARHSRHTADNDSLCYGVHGVSFFPERRGFRYAGIDRYGVRTETWKCVCGVECHACGVEALLPRASVLRLENYILTFRTGLLFPQV
jgi:hypothetical protein